MKKKVLCIVQLPPPVHGASLMNQSVVNSPLLNEHYRVKTINIATAGKIEGIGKFSVGKLFASLGRFFSIAAALLFYRPDLVYFTFSPTGFAFYRDAVYVTLVKLSGAELAIHLHGRGINAEDNGNKRQDRIRKRVFRGANVIFLSDILSNDLMGLAYKKKYVINCGIDREEIRPGTPNTTGACRLLFLSNYVRTKGIIDLIDAAALVAVSNPDFHLRLVGNPYDFSITELNDYIRGKGLEGKVVVCGPKYGDEKLEEYRSADVFTFPTFNDAFPLVLLEAMQWGIPCISTREGGIPDIINDRVTGMLVNQRNVQQLADSILFLLNNAAERRNMGIEARKVFLEKFTFDIFENNILQTFNHILGEGPGYANQSS